MSRDEQRVRAAWGNVMAMWSNSVSQPTFCLSLGVIWHDGLSMGYFKTEAAAWSAAAAFTDEVLAEAARMREEIAWVSCHRHSDDHEATYKRILSRLQALYDAHVRGLKSEALKGNQ